MDLCCISVVLCVFSVDLSVTKKYSKGIRLNLINQFSFPGYRIFNQLISLNFRILEPLQVW